jgi:hypothetical protein
MTRRYVSSAINFYGSEDKPWKFSLMEAVEATELKTGRELTQDEVGHLISLLTMNEAMIEMYYDFIVRPHRAEQTT